MPTIIPSLPQILVSRFLINLRGAAEHIASDDTAMQHFSRFSVPGFRVPTSTVDRVVGNLGEPLEFRDDAFDDENTTEHRDEGQPIAVEDHPIEIKEESRSAEVGDIQSVC